MGDGAVEHHACIVAWHPARLALELIGRERPDLVLSDVMMPVLSGAELCRRLKADSDTQNIPVILMSSAGGQSTHGAGGDAFLDKPFHLEDLESLVRRWLAR